MNTSVAKATILFVEDDEPIRTLAARVLRRTGFEVLVAADSPEALRIADAYLSVIHLLLVDITLPSGNGIALARAILAKRPESAVLYISGFEADALRLVQEGGAPMGGFLEKPFALDVLVNRVRAIVRTWNAKRPASARGEAGAASASPAKFSRPCPSYPAAGRDRDDDTEGDS